MILGDFINNIYIQIFSIHLSDLELFEDPNATLRVKFSLLIWAAFWDFD